MRASLPGWQKDGGTPSEFGHFRNPRYHGKDGGFGVNLREHMARNEMAVDRFAPVRAIGAWFISLTLLVIAMIPIAAMVYFDLPTWRAWSDIPRYSHSPSCAHQLLAQGQDAVGDVCSIHAAKVLRFWSGRPDFIHPDVTTEMVEIARDDGRLEVVGLVPPQTPSPSVFSRLSVGERLLVQTMHGSTVEAYDDMYLQATSAHPEEIFDRDAWQAIIFTFIGGSVIVLATFLYIA